MKFTTARLKNATWRKAHLSEAVWLTNRAFCNRLSTQAVGEAVTGGTTKGDWNHQHIDIVCRITCAISRRSRQGSGWDGHERERPETRNPVSALEKSRWFT